MLMRMIQDLFVSIHLIVQYLYLDILYIAEERLNQESEILNFSLKLTKKNSIIYDFLELN